MRVVLKLGGSLLYNGKGEINLVRIRKYSKVVTDVVGNGHELVIVVGGGKPARLFISAARDLGATETQCDWLGIKVARNNAELLCAALGNLAYPKVVESLDELETTIAQEKVVLMGGLNPGQSTNAVAALAAESVRAEMLLNATNVDGVYDRNPKEAGAVKLDEVNVDQLDNILSGSGTRAGEYKLFDPVAIRVVGRSKIPTVIFNGNDLTAVIRLLKGEKVGTRIVHHPNK
ncbi:MAG: UMP kinase [Candidatus Thorarchaeota archaeon]|nr:UMP kinase [Candidatus Thorarchaeota archaeon]